jgi:hypothetical protein
MNSPARAQFWQGQSVVIGEDLEVLNCCLASKLSSTSNSELQLFYDDLKLALPILGVTDFSMAIDDEAKEKSVVAAFA